MNKSILCTIDLSDTSESVLKYAVELSRKFHEPITVLYTYRLLNSNGSEAVESRKKIEDSARHKFSVIEKDVLLHSGVSYRFIMEVGFISNRVREYAKTNNVSMLVIGNKINPSTRESFDELAESIQIPLVIVP